MNTLLGLPDDWREWRNDLPPALVDSVTAQRLDDVPALRDLVEQLGGGTSRERRAGLIT